MSSCPKVATHPASMATLAASMATTIMIMELRCAVHPPGAELFVGLPCHPYPPPTPRPQVAPRGLVLAGCLPREDVRDVLLLAARLRGQGPQGSCGAVRHLGEKTRGDVVEWAKCLNGSEHVLCQAAPAK